MRHLTALRARLRDDTRGITLIELMITILIGMVVMMALFNLIDSSGRASSRISDKTETVQRLRMGLEKATRVLRTQVCLNSTTPPIVAGDANSVTFYSDTTGADAAFKPKKVQLTFSTASGGSLKRDTWEPQGTGPYTSASYTAPPVSETLMTDLGQQAGSPFLTYYGFNSAAALATPLSPTLTGTLPANSIAKVVQVDVALEGLPQNKHPDTRRRASAKGSVYVRNTDYSDKTRDTDRTWGPRCG